MEKKGKGLFERLMDFWKEKIHTVGEDRIGFWYEGDFLEEHFAEMGAVAALSQKEVQKRFSLENKDGKWKRAEELFSEEKTDEPQKKEDSILAESVRMFQEEEETLQGRRSMQILQWEAPEAEKERREHIVRAVQTEKDAELPKEETEEQEKLPVWIGPQQAAEIDVEKLMQQITKKLWEEREGCSRRLR